MSIGRILLISEAQKPVESAYTLLKEEGFEVIAVTSITEAINLLKKESFDLLIIANIDVKGGQEVVKSAQSIDPTLSILFITKPPDLMPLIQAIGISPASLTLEGLPSAAKKAISRTHSLREAGVKIAMQPFDEIAKLLSNSNRQRLYPFFIREDSGYY